MRGRAGPACCQPGRLLVRCMAAATPARHAPPAPASPAPAVRVDHLLAAAAAPDVGLFLVDVAGLTQVGWR